VPFDKYEDAGIIKPSSPQPVVNAQAEVPPILLSDIQIRNEGF
jgi:hypothetical protein